MPVPVLPALLALTASLQHQESAVPPPPRLSLPRPAANAPIAGLNQNRVAAGTLSGGTLTLALDIVEAGYQAEGAHDPVVRILAFAEPGKAPIVPGPMIRAPLGTTVKLTLRNRTDSTVFLSGLRRTLPMEKDTFWVAPGVTREVSFRLDRVGNYFYWAALKGLGSYIDRFWLDSQLTGVLIVDPPGAPAPSANERVWLITEWFLQPDGARVFESALTFNGKAWPYNERLTFVQGDSIHFRVINAAAVEHPLHLHGFYFRVERSGGERADTAMPRSRQALLNMRLIPIGGSLLLSFVPSTPGNWVFHCHFASHVGEDVTLHGGTDGYIHGGNHEVPEHDRPGGHTMRGLVIGMHVTPKPGYKEPDAKERRIIDLLIQKKPNALTGGITGYGFLVQKGTQVPARDSISIPGPVLELKRGQPVRIQVHNNLTDEQSGVHWHGLEIESYPDGVANFSGIGDRIMPPIPPGGMFAAEFTPPRSGTFPYHSHLHEMRQIGSGMYGAIIVSDTPRDTTRDHLIVAGGGGLPIFHKETPAPMLVNGRRNPRPIVMTAGVLNRIRIVSIHADMVLNFRFGTEEQVARWTPLAKDGADLPPAMRVPQAGLAMMGPGETADFLYTPLKPGSMQLEVWMGTWQRIVVPVEIKARRGSGQ